MADIANYQYTPPATLSHATATFKQSCSSLNMANFHLTFQDIIIIILRLSYDTNPLNENTELYPTSPHQGAAKGYSFT